MPGRWDWLKDEMGGISKLTQFSTLMKFLKGRITGPDDITKCSMCPNMCRHACPISIVDGKETTSPAGKSRVGMMIEHEFLSLDDNSLFPLHMCLSCGCCETWCPFDFSVSDILRPIKERGIEKGVEFESFRDMATNLERHGIVHGELEEETELPQKGDVLYLRGCEFRKDDQDVIEKTVKGLKKMDIDVFVMSDEVCCGIPAYNVGYSELFRKLAKDMARKINNSDAELVITSCPSCAYAYRELYPEFGSDIDVDVLHIVEFMERNKELLGKRKATVTFHDPCKLVNGLDRKESMKRVLESMGLSVKVPRRHGGKTFCCGYGGSTVSRLNEDLSYEISRERLNELKQESDKIITSCPTCKKAFDDDDDVNVYDIGELLYEVL